MCSVFTDLLAPGYGDLQLSPVFHRHAERQRLVMGTFPGLVTVLLEVSVPGKFTLRSVRPNRHNRTLGMKGFIPRFILMVAGQALESHPPQGESACRKLVSASRPPHPSAVSVSVPLRPLQPMLSCSHAAQSAGRNSLYRVNYNVLTTRVQAYACEHCPCAVGKYARAR